MTPPARSTASALAMLVAALATAGGCLLAPSEAIVTVSTDFPIAPGSRVDLVITVRRGGTGADASAPPAVRSLCLLIGGASAADVMAPDGSPSDGSSSDAAMGDTGSIGADVAMDAAPATPCTVITPMSRPGGGLVLGSFALTPRNADARSTRFDFDVSMTVGTDVYRQNAVGQLVPQRTLSVEVVMHRVCDRVITGAICGAAPCTFSEYCAPMGSVCLDVNGAPRCSSMTADGRCVPGETSCNEPACPSRVGDGCCSADESECTAPMDHCPPSPDNHCCEAGEASCRNPNDNCMPRNQDGCCDTALNEATCRHPNDGCMPRNGDGCCDTGIGEASCRNPMDNCAARNGDGCCDTGLGEAACRSPGDNCPRRLGDGCCDRDLGESVCSAPADGCPAAIGDGCCTPPENTCNEPACGNHCGNRVCDCGEGVTSCNGDCNCAARCCTTNEIRWRGASGPTDCEGWRATACGSLGVYHLRYYDSAGRDSVIWTRSTPCP